MTYKFYHTHSRINEKYALHNIEIFFSKVKIPHIKKVKKKKEKNKKKKSSYF